VKEVLCDIAPTNSCHLLLRWAWLHFKMLNLDERSLCLRHEGHEMKLKFMTRRKNWKRRNINCRRKGNWRKRKGRKDKDDGKGSRETRCLIKGHPCSVAFVYQSDNNIVSQRLVEKLQLPTSFHLNQERIKFGTGPCVKEVLCDIAPTNSCHLLWDGHCFLLKPLILINVPFVWGMRDMKRSWNLWHQHKPRRINIRWRRK